MEDHNDNSPSFSERTKNISLSETTPTQTSLSLGSAVDPDVGVFTTQRYEIVDGEAASLLLLSWLLTRYDDEDCGGGVNDDGGGEEVILFW